MLAKKLYEAIGEKSSGTDAVAILDKNSGITYSIIAVDREADPDSTGATLFIVVEEN